MKTQRRDAPKRDTMIRYIVFMSNEDLYSISESNFSAE